MRPPTNLQRVPRALAVLVAAILLAFPAACQRVAPGSRPTLADGRGVAVRHGAKDRAVLTEADNIDRAVADTPAAPAVTAATERQREAVAAAPAAEILALSQTFEKAIAELTKRAEVAEARAAAAAKAAQSRQVAIFTGAGVIALALAGLALWGRQVPLAGACALAGLGALGIAQIVGQAWFKWAVAGVGALALAGFAAAILHAYRRGDLATKTEREAARLKDTLGKVVPVLDAAYEDAEEQTKALLDRTIFDRLSSLFARENKQTIHQIRADQSASAA